LGADGAIDLKLYRGESQTPAVIVQCKAWNAYMVGVAPVRELRAAMAAQKVDQGFFVTSGAFTREATEFAAQEKIHLLGGNGLLEMIKALAPEQSAALLRTATEGDFSTPTCPACGVKMVPRKSRKGGKAFWGCVNYPRCRYTFVPAP
jgi:restriction system protein